MANKKSVKKEKEVIATRRRKKSNFIALGVKGIKINTNIGFILLHVFARILAYSRVFSCSIVQYRVFSSSLVRYRVFSCGIAYSRVYHISYIDVDDD